MAAQLKLLEDLAAQVNQRRPVLVEQYFTEDFRLDDAGAGIVLRGYAGAQKMIGDVLKLAPDFRYDMLDAVEAGDRVAVRWRITGTGPDGAIDVAMLAMYRFADGRIAEDWGIWSGKPWLTDR